jgi:hypothetical protein
LSDSTVDRRDAGRHFQKIAARMKPAFPFFLGVISAFLFFAIFFETVVRPDLVTDPPWS